MFLETFVITAEKPTDSKNSDAICFSIGGAFPLPLPVNACGGCINSLADGSTLFLNVAIPEPRTGEILGFRTHFRFGIYSAPELPGGLLMIHMTHNPKKSGLIFELPFDFVRQVEASPASMERFFTAKKIAILATLTDTSCSPGKVIAMRLIHMPDLVVQRLRQLWLGQIGTTTYDGQFSDLISRKSIYDLWAQATKY